MLIAPTLGEGLGTHVQVLCDRPRQASFVDRPGERRGVKGQGARGREIRGLMAGRDTLLLDGGQADTRHLGVK